jgi:deoxyribodipyrimidine photo-lyase
VFTAFARTVERTLEVTRPLSLPKQLPPLPKDVVSLVSKLADPANTAAPRLFQFPELAPFEHRDGLLIGGEPEALKRLKTFITKTSDAYDTARDRLAIQGTSRLSADLRFGSVSPRQVWFAASKSISNEKSRKRFLSQLLWREFAYSTLWERPDLLEKPFQRRFLRFPWRVDQKAFLAWTEGKTGYPIVDAAARQLLTEGYVHNRARMIAASFLAKDLLIDFRWGERHYLEWLIDGDKAQNDLGWQWSSGSGCDAQPYFRIFNPVTQGEKFDKEGDYVRRYIPELARVPNRYIHQPWQIPPVEQAELKIRIGRDYPSPIVEHGGARNRFLAIAAEHFQSPDVEGSKQR